MDTNNKETELQNQQTDNKPAKEKWRGMFNPEANDPKKDTSLTIAGIAFVILAVICVILSK